MLKLSKWSLKADEGTIHHHHYSNKILLVGRCEFVTMTTVCFGTPDTQMVWYFPPLCCNNFPCHVWQRHCYFMVHHLPQQCLPVMFLQAMLPFYSMTSLSVTSLSGNIYQSNIVFYDMMPPTLMSVNDVSPHNVAVLWFHSSPCEITRLSPCTVALTIYIILQYFLSPLNLSVGSPTRSPMKSAN